MNEMNIYQLAPINPKEHKREWKISAVQEIFIVRAASPSDARNMVSLTTNNASENTGSDHSTPISPWQEEKLSTCIVLNSDEYKRNGKAEILSHPSLQKEWEKLTNSSK